MIAVNGMLMVASGGTWGCQATLGEPPPSPAAGVRGSPETLHGPFSRVVAIGDLHGDADSMGEVLALAGLIDGEHHWSAGDTLLILMGDLVDRGDESRQVLEWAMRLEGEAVGAGGKTVVLLGNHEVMNITGDWRYVTPGDVVAFGGVAARKDAFGPHSAIGSWLRGRDAVFKWGETIFVHGGVSPSVAALGVEGVNRGVHAALVGAGSPDLLGADGPLWFRSYLTEEEPQICVQAEQALLALGAARMVMGHTTQQDGRIASRCGGRILGIDTGISDYYGRRLAALELRGDDAWALYPQGAEDLVDP